MEERAYGLGSKTHLLLLLLFGSYVLVVAWAQFSPSRNPLLERNTTVTFTVASAARVPMLHDALCFLIPHAPMSVVAVIGL
jgi:hypothetical protein